MRRCPCCGYLTIDDWCEVITDICEICFWQYDQIAQNKPDTIAGCNKVSLNAAKENYLLFGACEARFVDKVRLPLKSEV